MPILRKISLKLWNISSKCLNMSSPWDPNSRGGLPKKSPNGDFNCSSSMSSLVLVSCCRWLPKNGSDGKVPKKKLPFGKDPRKVSPRSKPSLDGRFLVSPSWKKSSPGSIGLKIRDEIPFSLVSDIYFKNATLFRVSKRISKTTPATKYCERIVATSFYSITI